MCVCKSVCVGVCASKRERERVCVCMHECVRLCYLEQWRVPMQVGRTEGPQGTQTAPEMEPREERTVGEQQA